ncbi:FtsB family cell division protein, partial [Albidovulum sp.]
MSAVLVVYFAYHLVQGDRGVIALNRLEGEVAQAETALETLRVRREALEVRVSQLSPPAIDRDLLVERGRIVLNLTHPHDV